MKETGLNARNILASHGDRLLACKLEKHSATKIHSLVEPKYAGNPTGGLDPEGNTMRNYIPSPIDTSHVDLPTPLQELTERLAENAHDNWAQLRFADGWSWGKERNDKRKKHPDLVPYGVLPDAEKEYDRKTVVETIKAILALGYTIDRSP